MGKRSRTLLAAILLLLLFSVHTQGESDDAPRLRTWLESGPPEACVDILFVGDGYTRSHLGRSGKYWRDVNRYAKRLFRDAPFAWCKKMFNVRAVFLESKDAGCIGSSKVENPQTALKSKFRGSRFLGFGDDAALKALLEKAGPVDIVFVMVNTERYGGGGTVLRSMKVGGRPLPAPTFAARDTLSFLTAVHELGHSFAGLADEYVEEGKDENYPLPRGDRDLRQANVTLARHIDTTSFETIAESAKWKHFLAMRGARRWAWAYEGGCYRDRGVFRPFPRCRMNVLADPFCPVCAEAIAKAIFETCSKTWDGAAYHKAHPLKTWR